MCVVIMNRITLAIILLCLPRLSEAQPDELSLSLKAGANAAAWDSEFAEHKYGFAGGLAGDLRWFRARFSLGAQMALLYMPRGTKGFDPTTGEFLATFRQHYFDTAVAFRPEARVGSVGVYLLLGGAWSILLNANAVDYRGRKVNVDIRRHDVALLAGLGGALHLPSHRLGPFHLGTVFLEARYDRGLLDFIPDDGSRKNRTTSLMLGVSFALGSKAAVAGPGHTE
jgi:hypothetical protein